MTENCEIDHIDQPHLKMLVNFNREIWLNCWKLLNSIQNKLSSFPWSEIVDVYVGDVLFLVILCANLMNDVEIFGLYVCQF